MSVESILNTIERVASEKAGQSIRNRNKRQELPFYRGLYINLAMKYATPLGADQRNIAHHLGLDHSTVTYYKRSFDGWFIGRPDLKLEYHDADRRVSAEVYRIKNLQELDFQAQRILDDMICSV